MAEEQLLLSLDCNKGTAANLLCGMKEAFVLTFVKITQLTQGVRRLTEVGMIGLKGHRSVGGLRASIYNAMSLDGVKALVGLMETFAAEKK